VQVPVPIKDTRPEPATVQTEVVELVTDVVPSPEVDTVGVKDPPKVPDEGRLVMDGVEGVSPTGTTADEAAEAALRPIPLEAVTEKV